MIHRVTKIKQVKRTLEKPQTKPRIKVTNTKFKQTRINFAWHVPTLNHPGTPAIEMLSLILGCSSSSRLHKSLMLQAKPLASDVSAGIYLLKDKGVFLVSCKLVEHDTAHAISKIGDELIEILSSPVSEEELSKALSLIESEEFYAMETVDGLSRKYGFYYNMSGDINYFNKYVTNASKVSSSDILNVGSYLNPDKVTISSITNKKKYGDYIKGLA